jgi:hypothetical protein
MTNLYRQKETFVQAASSLKPSQVALTARGQHEHAQRIGSFRSIVV